jgi:amidase
MTVQDMLVRDTLGAFCRHTHAAVAGASTGPLRGLTFGLKDIYDVAGHRTGFGSPDWLRTHEPAQETAFVPRALLDAGADLVGKTQTDELTYSLGGENAHYGTPVNVNAAGRIPGGSSSGSAAAVAGGLVDFAVGSDTGGSVRAPASYCGIYGIRPTHGRISLSGARPLAPGFDTASWFARDAHTLRRVGAVLLPGPQMPPPRRLLIARDAFLLARPAAIDALREIITGISGQFDVAVEIEVCGIQKLATWLQAFRILQAAEAWTSHGEWITHTQPALGPGIRERFDFAATVTEVQVAAEQTIRTEVRKRMNGLLDGNTVLALPTLPDIAPPLNAAPDSTEETRTRALTLLCIAGLAGLPQISMPVSRVNGCPLGLSLIGAAGSDGALLDLACDLAPR